MRVTGGKYRGKKIAAREIRTLRPTKSSIREAIFNILRHGRYLNSADFIEDDNLSRVEGRIVIDVFCGTGALGIEALSYGAAHAVFVDQDPKNMQLVRQNIDHIKEINNASFVRSDSTNLPRAMKKGELILIDPPYQQDLAPKTLKSLKENGWLEDGAIIIIESGKHDKITAPENFTQLDSRVHDKTRLTIMQFKE